MKISESQAKDIVREIANKAIKVFKQDISGENEEFLSRVLGQYRAEVARRTWKCAQKWSKWSNDGPVLMPDFTRIYYRKGKTEIVLQEFSPQIRLMRLRGPLVARNNTGEIISVEESAKIHHFSLALPYVIFIFKFIDGVFTEVRCAFSDRPLRKLEEKPLRPYLSNIDSGLNVCLGSSLDRSRLEKGNVAQQAALVLDHFWSSAYSDEWSSHFWANRGHFQANDPRLADMESWQQASIDNPLFVVEDVRWLPHGDDNFGDLIVRMLENDGDNARLQDELYTDLVENFMENIKRTFDENLTSISDQAGDKLVTDLSNLLIELLQGV